MDEMTTLNLSQAKQLIEEIKEIKRFILKYNLVNADTKMPELKATLAERKARYEDICIILKEDIEFLKIMETRISGFYNEFDLAKEFNLVFTKKRLKMIAEAGRTG